MMGGIGQVLESERKKQRERETGLEENRQRNCKEESRELVQVFGRVTWAREEGMY